MWKNIVVSGLVMTSLLLLPLMVAAGGHHGGGHGPRGYRNVDQWLQSLPEEQQVKARAILEEARPAIEDTRWRIRQKREELAHFDYAEDSSAETLSRLGWELQDLRDRLRLATFDDYLWNRAVYGGVTTAAQDTEAIAQAVLDRVVDRLSANVAVDGAAAPLRRELSGSIRHRASTDPMRSRA